MNSGLKWKLAVAFLLVFVAGVVTGTLAGAIHARRIFMVGPPHTGQLAEHMREHLRRELNLSDEQVAQIAPVVDATVAKLEAIRTETAQRVHQAMQESHNELAPHLTAEQQKKLAELEQEHRRQFRHHGGLMMHGGPPP
jgi:Spy/CpxP family protein refolding chaperone